MSIYCTPCQFFDKETSCSEDSVYVTPEASLTDSVFERYCPTPKSCDAFDWRYKKIHYFNTTLATKNKIHRRRKCVSDSIFDKENIVGCSPANVPRSDARPSLKCISNLFNADQGVKTYQLEGISVEETVDSKPFVKPDIIVPRVENSNWRNVTVCRSADSNLFRGMKFLQRLKTKCEFEKKKDISDSIERIVIEIPKSNYGSVPCEKPHSKEQKSPHIASQFSSSILQKCRLVYLKRLFSRPVTSIRSCYAKYLQRFRRNQYQSLNRSNSGTTGNTANISDINRENVVEQSKLACSLTPGVSELLQTIISKLSSLENEVRELKSLIKENNSRGSLSCFPAPPPPPPPPPPPLPLNFTNHSSTPKRKVDLTTPENQQLAKRPSRAQEQRTQFSVTVEDLRNVKLRKIGNSIVKKMNAEKNSIVEPVSLPSPVRTTALRSKRNRVVEKELCEIASELFSSRMRDNTSDATLICSPITRTNIPRNTSIYEQTPKRTKCRSSIFSKRKEFLDESSSRKLLISNDRLSSPRSRTSISDTLE